MFSRLTVFVCRWHWWSLWLHPLWAWALPSSKQRCWNWIDGAAGKCLASSFLGKSHGVRNDGWKNDLKSRGKGRSRMLRGNGGKEGFIPKGTEQFIPIQIPMSLEFLNHYVNRRHLWFILMLEGVFHWSLDVKSVWWYRLPHLSSLRDMIFQLLKIMLFLIS